MEIQRVEVEMSRTFDLGGGYNSLKLTVRLQAVVTPNENIQDAADTLRTHIRQQFREEALLYPQVFKGQTQFLIAGVPVDMTPELLLELQEKALATTNGKR